MALHDFKSQRLFIDEGLSQGRSFELARDQANYLLNVLRMTDGNSILVFNGRDGEWKTQISAKGRKKCDLTCVEQVRQQPEALRLIYCFAPLKQARLDYMVQKAVEMGAGILQPVITQHTQIRQIKDNRLHSNAIEAAEQCGILTLPEIREPVSLYDLPDALGNDTQLVFCDEAEHDQNPFNGLNIDNSEQIALLIGPEGGFSEDERNFLNEQKNVFTLGLGPRILRADTAAVAALAVIQSAIGDWYKKD